MSAEGIGSATRDGITFSSNTLSDEQIRERLDRDNAPAAPETPAEPVVETAQEPPTEPVAKTESQPKKKFDPTKDPETRISKATYEREEARREAAKERAERERVAAEFAAYKAEREKSSQPTAPRTDAEPTLTELIEKHKNADDPYAAAIYEQNMNGFRKELAQREQAAIQEREKARQQHAAHQRDQAEQTRIAAFGQKLTEAMATNPDLETQMAASDIEITRPMADAIIESDAPDRLISHLLANRAEVDRIAALDSPLKQFRALARLDAQLEPASPGHSGTVVPKKTAAQPPISPVGGGHAAPATGEPDPHTATQEEFEAYWNAREKAERLAGARR